MAATILCRDMAISSRLRLWLVDCDYIVSRPAGSVKPLAAQFPGNFN